MDKYRHMAYLAGSERHLGPGVTGSFPKAMLFASAGNEVNRMDEPRWPALLFATSADPADFAARQCRSAIDWLYNADCTQNWPVFRQMHVFGERNMNRLR